MPIFDFHCRCGHHFELLLASASSSAACGACGGEAVRVPSRFALHPDRPAPLNTEANYRIYREIVDETMDIGRQRAEEQQEPAGEYGAGLIPRGLGQRILAAHKTFEGGLAE